MNVNLTTSAPKAGPTLWENVQDVASQAAKRLAFTATNMAPLEKSVKIINFSIMFFRSVGVQVGTVAENLSSNIKAFTDFADSLKVFRPAADWCNYEKMLKNSWQKIAKTTTLLVAGIIGTVRYIDKTFNKCLGGISAISLGKLPLLGSVKDALIMLSSSFSISDVVGTLPRTYENKNHAEAHLNKWSQRSIELLEAGKGNQAVLNALQQRAQEKLQSLKVVEAPDDKTVQKIRKYERRLEISQEQFLEELSAAAAFKKHYWSVKANNDAQNLKRSWLSLADDITKLVAISLVFAVATASSAAAGGLLIALAAIGIVNNSIGLKKAWFDEFDLNIQPLPKRVAATA